MGTKGGREGGRAMDGGCAIFLSSRLAGVRISAKKARTVPMYHWLHQRWHRHGGEGSLACAPQAWGVFFSVCPSASASVSLAEPAPVSVSTLPRSCQFLSQWLRHCVYLSVLNLLAQAGISIGCKKVARALCRYAKGPRFEPGRSPTHATRPLSSPPMA